MLAQPHRLCLQKTLGRRFAEPLAWANSQNLGGGKFWLFAILFKNLNVSKERAKF